MMPKPKILEKSKAPNGSLVVTGDPPHCGPPAKFRDEMNAYPVLKPIVSKYITDGSNRIVYWPHCRQHSVNQK